MTDSNGAISQSSVSSNSGLDVPISGNKESQVSESMTVIDRVTYKNLIVGKEYTLKGTLLTTDTQGIVAESDISFIPESPDGFIDITFIFDG